MVFFPAFFPGKLRLGAYEALQLNFDNSGHEQSRVIGSDMQEGPFTISFYQGWKLFKY